MTANQQKAYLKRVAKEEEESIFKGREVYATKHKESSTKKKSCINFAKSIKNNFNVMHNDRSLKAEHIKDGEFEVNRTADEAIELKEQMIQKAIEAYEANKSKRAPKFRAKDYGHSAVVLIKPDTTMQDLEVVAKHFETKYGFQCYQIAIHRDEGHYPKNVKGDPTPLEINHHAHFEFITLDKNTGKNRWRDVNQKVMSDFQTEVAQILQMERGIDKRITGAYHLNHYQYRHKAQAQELERLEMEQHIKPEIESKKENQIKLTSDKSERIYLDVLFDEKDEAKALGAKFDWDKKQWYVPQVDSAPFGKWLPSNFKTKSQEIAELRDIVVEKDEALNSLQHKLNTAQALFKSREASHQGTIGALLKKHDTEIETIKEQHKKEVEALQKSHNQEKQALEAKISDFNQKQWVSITQDEFSDLKANYEAEKGEKDYITREEYQDHFQKLIKIVCYGDEVKAREMDKFEVLESKIFELAEFKKAHQELQREPRQAQIQAKAKSKDDFER